MIQYDSDIIHTGLWEEIIEQPWESLTESKGPWKNPSYKAFSTLYNNRDHGAGYTVRQFSNWQQFLNSIRPDVINKTKLPAEYYIGFISPKTLDKVEITTLIDDPDVVQIEMITAKALKANKLKTKFDYDDDGREIATRYDEPDKRAQNILTWDEKRTTTNLQPDKALVLLKSVIDKLRRNQFREISPGENIRDLLKNESFQSQIIDMKRFNEVFQQELTLKRLYEEDDPIADDLDLPIPGKAMDFNNYRAFLDFIDPKKILTKPDHYFPLDIYIEFVSKDNAKVAAIWLAYKNKPTGEHKQKEAVLTFFSCIPFIYRRVGNSQRQVIKTVRNRADLIELVQSEDLYMDWNYKREPMAVTIIQAKSIANNLIMKLLGNNFTILPDGSDVLKFCLRGDASPSTTGRGRPKGATKKNGYY